MIKEPLPSTSIRRSAKTTKMVIEWLKFKVVPKHRERFVQKDAKIWTEAIARYPGFLGKEVWLNPKEATEVVLIIRWATREQWKSIPRERLRQIEQQFAQQMGSVYQMIESAEYQVRKFPRL